MTEPDPIGAPSEREVLEGRLRLLAGTLGAEFGGLSRTEAERLIFEAARELLSAASVVQFVPTFAERRARRLLRGGLPSTGGPSPDPATPQPEPTPPPRLPPPPSKAAGLTPAPPWPDSFYAAEAKRLLEKARVLRAAHGAARPWS